jgi:hypothetical protein
VIWDEIWDGIWSWDWIWQIVMVSIGLINLIIALVLFFRSFKWKAAEPNNARYFRRLRTGGLVFITVALYRSVFVAKYDGHLAWWDTIFNSPFIIRCLAACAEMAFISMIGAILVKMCRECEHANDDRPLNAFITNLPYIAIVSIFLAQFGAFTTLIAQYPIAGAIEESLWALAFICVAIVVIVGWAHHKQLSRGFKPFLVIMTIWCVGYLAFQCGYALPFMYFADLNQAGVGFSWPALQEAIFSYTQTRDFGTWGGLGFFIWHSGYFSICSWMTLVFMSAPRPRVAK